MGSNPGRDMPVSGALIENREEPELEFLKNPWGLGTELE
jgi:hypothetical protein